jgi:hypothetical protein
MELDMALTKIGTTFWPNVTTQVNATGGTDFFWNDDLEVIGYPQPMPLSLIVGQPVFQFLAAFATTPGPSGDILVWYGVPSLGDIAHRSPSNPIE